MDSSIWASPLQGWHLLSLQLLPRANLETWAYETLTEGQDEAPVNHQAEAATSGSLCRRKKTAGRVGRDFQGTQRSQEVQGPQGAIWK